MGGVMDKATVIKAEPVKVPAAVAKRIALSVAAAENLPAIDSAEHYAAAVAKLRDVRADLKAFTELFEDARRPLNEARAKAIELQRTLLSPLEAALVALDSRCLAWEDEQARLRREAEKAARLAAEAEARREREEQLARLAEAAKARPDVAQQAEALARMPVVPRPGAYIAPADPLKAAGGHRKRTWRAEVTDFPALVMAVAAPLLRAKFEERLQEALAAAPFDEATAALMLAADEIRALLGAAGVAEVAYLEPDLPALNKVMAACGGESPVPGVAAVENTSKAVLR